MVPEHQDLNSQKLLRVHVAAKRMDVAARTVRWYIETAQIAAQRIGRRAWGVRESDLNAFQTRSRGDKDDDRA